MFIRALLSCLVVALATSAHGDDNKGVTRTPHGVVLKNLTVYPTQIILDGPRAQHRLGVNGSSSDGRESDLSREAKLTSSAPAVATVEAGAVIRAVGDGDAVVTVHAGGLSKTVSVSVRRATADVPVSFTQEIVPLLTKAGCNQGACHGGQHGKGGFRLSLRGFDPAFDHEQIVQSAEGRRVVLSDPERSILLLKPTLTMEHGGGERFPVHSPSYELLKQWLEDGAPVPTASDAAVTRLEVWPARRVMAPGDRQQIIVRAAWSNGKDAPQITDVTATAQYDSLNDSVASVSTSGLVEAKGQGETHVMVRFGGQAAVVQITLPYALIANYPAIPAWNFIDEKLLHKWKDLGLTPSPLCGDDEFLRRIHLDTIGTLPAAADVKTFLAEKDPDKRKKAIDRVLDRPEFVDFWALKWSDLLRINRAKLTDKGMWSFYNWVRASVRDNKPVDDIVREIVTAEGSTFTDGPTNFYRTSPSPTDWAETTSQLFLGVRVQYAKCHHHPFEKWSQEDYYGLAAFFARLSTKGSREFGLFGGETIVFLRPTGEISHPRKGGVVKAHPLDGPIMEDPFDRRRKLAEWLTAKDNPFFARNMVNRFWGYYMGRGLVEPLDDMRATNPPSNADLLDSLARDFAEHKFDLKHLLRTIMKSRAYQLSSAVTPGNQADVSNVQFTRYTVKRLTAEQLADALDMATGTREKYQGLPPGTRAIQLPDPAVRSFLLDVFGRPARQITCECERTVQPNIAQALHLLNGDFLNQKISSPAGRVETLIKAKAAVPAIVEDLYLATLSRLPSSQEALKAQGWICAAPTPKDGAQDLLWTLLNSREFLFNH
jgi:hypothetical protein